MFTRHSSRLIQGLLNGVVVLGLAAAFWGSLQVWQKEAGLGEVAAAPPVIILITHNGFDPESFLVSVGESVTWRNDTGQPVEIGSSRHCYQYVPLLLQGAGENGSGSAAAIPSNFGGGWHSGLIAPGATYSTVFTEVGDYPVYLDCRTDVSGTIMVRSATPTPLPTPSDTPVPTAGATATFTPGPSPTPSPTGPTPYTPSPSATFTPGPSPTSTPPDTPTPTIGPSPTVTRTPSLTPSPTATFTPGPSPTSTPTGTWSPTCPTQFEQPVRAGDQFVPVTGGLTMFPDVVQLYWVDTSTQVLIAEAELQDFGPGHACPGHADLPIDPSQFVLVAGMLIVVHNTLDGSADYTFVLPAATPTP